MTADGRTTGGARVDGLGLVNLAAVLAPGALFAVGLLLLRTRPGFEWVNGRGAAPAELWVVAVGGSVATLCGVLDWRYHRAGRRVVPRAEQRTEGLALVGGGLPLFAFTAAATTARDPRPWLVGAVAAALFCAGAIAVDEVRHHRRCTRYETLLHRGLVGGNGAAWLAWLWFCLTRSGRA